MTFPQIGSVAIAREKDGVTVIARCCGGDHDARPYLPPEAARHLALDIMAAIGISLSALEALDGHGDLGDEEVWIVTETTETIEASEEWELDEIPLRVLVDELRRRGLSAEATA